MKYLATVVASFLLITPFSAFAQTTQEQHDALIMQLITILTQEVQALQSELQAQVVATGGAVDTTTTATSTAIQAKITPVIQQLTMPADQTEIIIHDDSDFYSQNPNKTYAIFVKNKDGEFDPQTVATFTSQGKTEDWTLHARVLFDTSTAMTNPHQEWGTLYHSTGTFTVSALGLDKTITL